MLWCIVGIPLTAIGGLNCTPSSENSTSENSTLKNTCYYDIDGDKADLYRAMSILLIVLHCLSLLFFFLSCQPFKQSQDKIDEDPTPAAAEPEATQKPDSIGTSDRSATVTSITAPLSASQDDAVASGSATTSIEPSAPTLSSTSGRDLEKKAGELELKIRKLTERQEELELREQSLRRSHMMNTWHVPPPPRYSTIVDIETQEQPPDFTQTATCNDKH